MKKWFQSISITQFPLVLGCLGFSMGVRRVESVFNWSFGASLLPLGVSALLFAWLFVGYVLKATFTFQDVRVEFKDSVKMNFFPMISICMLLFSMLIFDLHSGVSRFLWWVGTPLQVVLTLVIVSQWMQREGLEVTHLNPIWFIPAVANLIVPLSGTPFVSTEVLWVFFGVGFLFWLVLFILLFFRLVFYPPFKEKLLPSLFILIVPPAIAPLAYLKLTHGSPDLFVRILYSFSLFMFLLLVAQLKRFFKIEFALSWWAYSFPLAALISATLMMYQFTGVALYKYFALTLFVVLNGVVAMLSVKTIGFMAKQSGEPEGSPALLQKQKNG